MPVLPTVKVELHKITFTPNGGSATVIGVTEAGSKITGKADVVDIVVAEFGKTPMDLAGNGWDIQVALTMSSSTIDNLVHAISSAKVTDTAKHAVGFDPRAGRLFTFGELSLHPLDLAAINVSRNWTFFKAAIRPDLTADYVATKAVGWPIIFQACVSQNQTTGNVRVGQFGDPTVLIDYDAGLS